MGMREEVKQELVHHIIPFWEKLKDEEYGGYYGYVDFELHVDKTCEKGCILNSRILWFFANAYMTLGDAGLLEYARHAYDFLKKYCWDTECGGVFWSVTFDGKTGDETKHTYSQAFAIYALSSYYDASKDREALKLAWQLFHRIEESCTDAFGYLESFTRDWKPEDNEKLSENGLLADKTMNTLLHVLEAYTELYRVSGDEKVKEALYRSLRIFREKVYREDTQQLEVFFDTEMRTISDLYSYGHDIEASWLLDRAVQVLRDGKQESLDEQNAELLAETSEYTTRIAERIAERALCDVSMNQEAMNNECFLGVVDTTHVWWVQAEAMVGFYNCYQKTGNSRFLEITQHIWNYTKEYVIDEREGAEWYWDLDKSGKPVSGKPIAEPWKCPYHNGRMCMDIIMRTEK